MFSSNLAYKTDSYLKKLISSSSLVQFASQNSLAVKRIHNIIFCWNVNTSCVFSYSKFFVVESFVTAFLYHCPNFVDWERIFFYCGGGGGFYVYVSDFLYHCPNFVDWERIFFVGVGEVFMFMFLIFSTFFWVRPGPKQPFSCQNAPLIQYITVYIFGNFWGTY